MARLFRQVQQGICKEFGCAESELFIACFFFFFFFQGNNGKGLFTVKTIERVHSSHLRLACDELTMILSQCSLDPGRILETNIN
jgi:hypothetical protein